MSILVPAALVFSAIIPIILLFYFMRPRRQERVVSSTLLWRLALQDLQASRPWQRLRITPLLLLQLLAAIFIVLVLTRPAIFTNNPLGGDTVIVLQASASMQATDVAPNRFENARSTISDLIDEMGPTDQLSLIEMARTPQVLIANSADKAQLHNALQHARVTNQNADLEQALSLATSLIEGHAHAQVLVVGDGHVQNPDQGLVVPFPVRYMRVGTNAPNVAFTALDSRVVQGKLTAFAQVANFSPQQRSVPVELYADNRLVGVQTAVLSAGGTEALQWTNVPSNARMLHAHLLSQDAMSIDHDSWSIIGGSMPGRVLLVTQNNALLKAALRIQPNINLYETTPDKYVDTGTFDLTVFDGYIPPKLPNGSLFIVNPPNGTYPFGTSGQETAVSHINAGNDPLNLLNAVDLGSIHVLRSSHQLKLASWMSPLITAPETPLLAVGENASQRVAVLGFDLHDSDLPLQYSFPVLISNLVNWFLPQPVGNNGQVTAGTPVSIQSWPGADKITITSPDGKSVQVGPPVTPYSNTNQVGIYQVSQHVRGQTLNGAFTVNLFDPQQSNLTPAPALPVVNSTNFAPGSATVSHELREIWPWIAALLLLILCAEWWLFSRSYQPQGATSERRHTTGAAKSSSSQFARWQQQLTERYQYLRRQMVRTTRKAKNRLTRRKGEKHANV